MCQASMTTPTVITLDAPQAYEVLHQTSITRDTEYILGRAEKSDDGLVAVYNTLKAITTRSPN
eukprot:7553283-Karenia_brevis.AAC.1